MHNSLPTNTLPPKSHVFLWQTNIWSTCQHFSYLTPFAFDHLNYKKIRQHSTQTQNISCWLCLIYIQLKIFLFNHLGTHTHTLKSSSILPYMSYSEDVHSQSAWLWCSCNTFCDSKSSPHSLHINDWVNLVFFLFLYTLDVSSVSDSSRFTFCEPSSLSEDSSSFCCEVSDVSSALEMSLSSRLSVTGISSVPWIFSMCRLSSYFLLKVVLHSWHWFSDAAMQPTFMWIAKEMGRRNSASHSGHEYVWLWCVRTCLRSWYELSKEDWHFWHLSIFFSFPCFFMCDSRLLGQRKTLLQSLHCTRKCLATWARSRVLVVNMPWHSSHLYSEYLMCFLFLCRRKAAGRSKLISHSSHLYGFCPMCFCRCTRQAEGFTKAFQQMPQM